MSLPRRHVAHALCKSHHSTPPCRSRNSPPALRRACHVALAVRTVVAKIPRFHPVLYCGLTVLAHHYFFPGIPGQFTERLSARNPSRSALVAHYSPLTCSPNWMRLMHSHASGQPQVKRSATQHCARRWKTKFTSSNRHQHANELFKYFRSHN